MKTAQELLKEYFGYDSFRKEQKEIIDAIVNNNDTLAIMPTGGGKSICYQISSLMMKGVTLVISPLISLMKDQVDNIKTSGIDAAYINSSLSISDIKNILYKASIGEFKLIYVAPERLQSNEFLSAISSIQISQVAIDEAHCVSQWGHDFRTSYRYIKDFINLLKTRPVISAFTATATTQVQEDIVKLLDLKNPKLFISGFDRENLSLTVLKGVNKDKYILKFLNENKNVSGIIYCLTRKDTEKLYSKLIKADFNATLYHGGLSSEERAKNQDDFVYDRSNIIVATNAFGMGIDKSDVRFVIHYNMPQNIEGYYQEIGRAGRDGEKSECILLFAPGDVHMCKYLIEHSIENPERRANQYAKLQLMTQYVYTDGCYKNFILKYFGENPKSNCNNCSNCNRNGEMQDRTIDAQKVLSCIFRMKHPFGSTMIIDVLKGSKNQRLLSFNFNTLTTYGLMKEYNKNDLKEFINKLIGNGYLDMVEGQFPVIKLNKMSYKILKGEQKVLLIQDEKVNRVFESNDLFAKLKLLRAEISKEENLPPYMIFSDSALLEMSNRYPSSIKEFMDISGVGESKSQKYGDKFINAITDYIKEKNINITFTFKDSLDSKTKDVISSNELNVTTDDSLLKELFETRKKIADSKGKLPYTVIPLKTLKEISARYPSSNDELKDISGLGPKKISDFGLKIINTVTSYKDKNNINSSFIYKDKMKVIIDGETRKNDEIVIDKLNSSEKISDISNELEISASTIMGYIENYLSDGNSFVCPIDYSEYINEEHNDEIINAIKKHGYEKISILKKALPDSITYDSIRASILQTIYDL
ncbi:DNA helicase RecQ [Clostridium sp. BJN0001]|uniref:DNA helicase RecQ n=1 Tax=Clostridium sp. BJN0001 TaxID=2930219 RepID=UPI001FD0776D|nr:DNA helicase RecQ [Clostridium sp. BJN0001]